MEAGDAGDYACEAVDARSGAVVFTAVTTLAVSGDFTRRSTLDHCLARLEAIIFSNLRFDTYQCLVDRRVLTSITQGKHCWNTFSYLVRLDWLILEFWNVE